MWQWSVDKWLCSTCERVSFNAVTKYPPPIMPSLGDDAAYPAYTTCTRKTPAAPRLTAAERHRVRSKEAYRKRLETVEIVTWDGEGDAAPDGEPQPYTLFMNNVGGEWYEATGLATAAVFRAMIVTAHAHPKAIHFIYGGSYDVNQWVKDLDEKRLRELWQTGSTYWGDYYIEYRPRKMFTLKHIPSGIKLTIWDAFSWCQSSFVKALRDYLGAEYEDLEMITKMKARRSDFSAAERWEVRIYTQAELRALASLVRILMQRLRDAGIYVKRWDGPGAAAAALLGDNGIAHHKAETPDAVRYAAAVAYSGGRIELMQYGNYEGTLFHYDIHSAYPAAMRDLPTLRSGSWTHYVNDGGYGGGGVGEQLALVGNTRPQYSLTTAALYHLKWSPPALHNPRPFYPFPYRTDDGAIYYPAEGESWVWGPEYIAYLKHADKFDLIVECVEAYVFEPASDARPFEFVETLYTRRQQWKREGNAAEWALKLGLNSLYGKLAQTIGWSEKRKPPFYQIEWAGLITSTTRAALFDAAMQNPESIVMFATDGIFATAPLELKCTDDLGDWEELTHDGLTVCQSGVYFVKDGDAWRTWSRGYNVEELHRDEIIDAWKSGVTTLPIPQTRYITMGSALAGKEVSPHWRSWKSAPRDLQLRATGKRSDRPGAKRADRSLVRTDPAYIFGESLAACSAPYNRAWKDNQTERIQGVPLTIYEAELAESVV